MTNRQGSEGKWAWLKYYTGIRLEGLRKTTETSGIRIMGVQLDSNGVYP
jgi:hypothetical protein